MPIAGHKARKEKSMDPERYQDSDGNSVPYTPSGASYQQSERSRAGYQGTEPPYLMGSDAMQDTVMARNILEDDALTHSYEQDSWGGAPPFIVTENDLQARPIQYAPDWNPSFSHLANASWEAHSQFPLTQPHEREAYETAVSGVVDGKIRQDFARAAWGDLDQIGRNYDPDDSENEFAREISVQAAFDVSTSASKFNTEGQRLRSLQAEREAEVKAAEARKRMAAYAAGPSSGDKRNREGGGSPSSSAGSPPQYSHKSRKKGPSHS
ncbi:hypothetical protein P3L51_35310 [Streptomyces sp. PSRA5]|uniref:hypothetical protein n=1 Tax=Streptomyces panacea TaxID=3035064 RepID=UPI00339C2975